MPAISGAAAILSIEGKQVGYATGVNAQETITQVPIQILGEIDVQEFEPVAREVSFSADMVRISNKSLQQESQWPRGGTLDIVNFAEMTATLVDSSNADIVLCTLEGVVPETRTWRVDQQSIMTVNCTFRARRMHDEQDS